MGNATDISWTDATWNPIRGCRRTAPKGSTQSGCGDPTGGGCYAEVQAARFCGPGGAYEGLIKLTANGPRWSGKTKFVGEHLTDPMRWREPRRIFVDSMSDLFYEGFADEEIAAIFGVMLLAAQHTYQILTKRAERMRRWFERWTVDACLDVLARVQLPNGQSVPGGRPWNRPARREWCDVEGWPVPWIWLGVSVENQAAADERIPDLLATPASVRFLSCEPLLGPVDLHAIQIPGEREGLRFSSLQRQHDDRFGQSDQILSWVIAGCESGRKARECDPVWLRSLRDQCGSAGVAFFLKQAEESADCGLDRQLDLGDDDTVAFGDGSRLKGRPNKERNHVIELPYLDGVQHAQFPEVR